MKPSVVYPAVVIAVAALALPASAQLGVGRVGVDVGRVGVGVAGGVGGAAAARARVGARYHYGGYTYRYGRHGYARDAYRHAPGSSAVHASGDVGRSCPPLGVAPAPAGEARVGPRIKDHGHGPLTKVPHD